MLEKIKIIIGITDDSKDNLLALLIEQATSEAINITHNDKTDNFENIIIQMVIWNYNRLGTEGLNSESYSGVTFNYSSDYPNTLINQLHSYRKVRIVG